MLSVSLPGPALLGAGDSLSATISFTAGVVVAVVLLLRFIVPTAIEAVFQAISWGFERVGFEQIAAAVPSTNVKWGVGRGIIRVFQITITAIGGVLILSAWGLLDPVSVLIAEYTLPVTALVKALITLLLLVGAYSGMGLLHRWIGEITEQSDQISPHQEEIWLRVLQIVFLIAAAIVALALWGIDLGGLLVGAGFLGIVAGLAAQQTLGALIAGFVLMLSRPFEIGDWVKVGDQEGIVTEITIVNTRLENFDGEIIALPNDVVGNSMIVNRSAKGRLRLRVEVGIDYGADPDHAQDVAVAALDDVDRVLSVPKPRVVTSRFGDSAIVLELRFWIDKPSARRRALATSAAIAAVNDAFQEAGIKIPFPQRELSGRAETGGFQVLDADSEEEG